MATAQAAPQYVGAEQCRSCHRQAYQHWQQSDHYKAMQPASTATVLGNFDNTTVTFHGISSRLYRQANQFFIETLNAGGQRQSFLIHYTFGHYPLQQYLVATEKGKLQALNIAWDSRSKAAGGQRWYHLQADENITPQHPFFWAGHFQNWNSRCAECHVTNYKKGFNPQQLSFNSTWSDTNVACEACHGPGSRHIELARQGQLSGPQLGFERRKPRPLVWQYNDKQPIAQPQGQVSNDHITMCGGCHALRMPLAAQQAGKNFHDSYRLQLLHQGTYFADGQINDEVFVLGSFLQSKMHQQGVSCGDCHNPHTGNVNIAGNGLCAQCHAPVVYDASTHHHHASGSDGALCVNCHMPARTYMGVDNRRDHSFTIPRPGLSQLLGVPNACTTCHKDKDNNWAMAVFKQWRLDAAPDHWGVLNQRGRDLDRLAAEPIAAAVLDSRNTTIVRATLMSQLAALPSRTTITTAQRLLQEADPLLRRAAVTAVRSLPGPVRWQLLAPLMTDPSPQVRFEVAAALAELWLTLSKPQREALTGLIADYRNLLAPTLDSPASQLALASLELALGNRAQALRAYQQALAISPGFVPALLSLSEFYRAEAAPEKSYELLRQALAIAPDSATVQHLYGLHLIRAKNYQQALAYLQRATELADAQPRHAYVYAVALDSTGQTKQAIKVLQQANRRWPNQYDLLLTLVLYKDKTGSLTGLHALLTTLRQIAPQSPQLRQLLQKHKLDGGTD